MSDKTKYRPATKEEIISSLRDVVMDECEVFFIKNSLYINFPEDSWDEFAPGDLLLGRMEDYVFADGKVILKNRISDPGLEKSDEPV